MGRLIPKETLSKLNGLEIAILILSGLLHDVGMVVSNEEKQAALDSEEFVRVLAHNPDRQAAIAEARKSGRQVRAMTIADALLAEYFRKVHASRIAAYIKSRIRDRIRFRDFDH
jgi:HD superfamily phosphodiesterase